MENQFEVGDEIQIVTHAPDPEKAETGGWAPELAGCRGIVDTISKENPPELLIRFPEEVREKFTPKQLSLLHDAYGTYPDDCARYFEAFAIEPKIELASSKPDAKDYRAAVSVWEEHAANLYDAERVPFISSERLSPESIETLRRRVQLSRQAMEKFRDGN